MGRLSLVSRRGAIGAGSTIAGERHGGLFASLQLYRDYRLLWLSTVFTQIGQWMLTITLGWLILTLTNSAAWVGLVAFASGLPFILVSVPAGVLIDRVDQRRLLVACQAAAIAIGLGLALLATLGLAQPWHLLLASFLNGAVLAINSATRQTLVPTFVAREHLGNAIGLMSAGQNVTRILGPSLGGPAIALLGSAGALYLQSGFLLAALINTVMLPAVLPRGGKALALRRNLTDGLAVIWRSPALLGLMILATIPSLLVFPYLQFLPVYARDILRIGASGLGLLFTASGIGAVTGALLVAGAQALPRKGQLILGGTLLYTLIIVGFAYARWVPLSLLLIFGCGALGSFYMGLNNTLLHLHVDDEMRGRVMGVYTLTSGLSTLGALPMGFLGARIGVPSAIGIAAGLTFLITAAAALRLRTLREL